MTAKRGTTKGGLKVVPLVMVQPPPEFGELQETPEFHDMQAMNGDYTYVPGFSEQRYARDREINEVVNGRRRPQDVRSLTHNFRWARCQSKKGEPDSRKVVKAGNRGYQAVTKDMVGEGKLLPTLPAGAAWHVDGTLRQGDTQLMVATADRVARNEFNKRARTEASTRGAEAGFEAALDAVGGRPVRGASPFIQKEVGKPVELAPTQKSK